MTDVHVVNGVKMIDADVEVDIDSFRVAYVNRCKSKIAQIKRGIKGTDTEFTVFINGTRRPAYIVYEREDMYGPVVVAKYLFDTDEYGEWFDLILIDLYTSGPSAHQLIRGCGSTSGSMGILIDAGMLLDRD